MVKNIFHVGWKETSNNEKGSSQCNTNLGKPQAQGEGEVVQGRRISAISCSEGDTDQSMRIQMSTEAIPKEVHQGGNTRLLPKEIMMLAVTGGREADA